ncbi:MAG: hypothetical protein HQL48_02205 [Gammaproteobacteria bacterium]|nr:hypothetical protein [Gammaproteobacteria bacterium]
MNETLTFWDHVTLALALVGVIAYIIFRIWRTFTVKPGSNCGCGGDCRGGSQPSVPGEQRVSLDQLTRKGGKGAL